MSDLISRQAVMDTTKTVMKDMLDSLPTRLEDGEEVYDVRTSELDFILGINKALQNAIKALPSETHGKRTETHGVCSDAISRQAAMDYIGSMNMVDQIDEQAYIEAMNYFESLPSANKSGKWIHDTHYGLNLPEHKCSECGTWEYSDEESNFCPHCGADMRGGDNETD